MKIHAPSVLTVLCGCLHGRRVSKAKKQKSRIFDADSVVSVCCAILNSQRTESENESSAAYNFSHFILWACIKKSE